MPILFLDLDNTLIDRTQGFHRWARDFLAAIDRPGDEVAWLESIDGDGLTPRTSFFQSVRARYRLHEPVDVLVGQFFETLPSCIPPLAPGARRALGQARRAGWTLCIVTNGVAVQRAKIEGTGLDAVVDGIVTSQEAACAKPDPRILALAAKAVGVGLSDGDWLIGDRAETDILCATRGGIRSAWIHRGSLWTERAYAPTIIVASVEEGIGRIVSDALSP